MLYLEEISRRDAQELYLLGQDSSIYVQKNSNSSIERLDRATGYSFADFMLAIYYKKGEAI